MLSFWEKESFLTYDTIIIGGGIVGVSAAVSLKEKSPQRSILILERGLFPSGASTRNAGFACFGSLTEIHYDIAQNGEEKTLAVIEKRIRGLEKLRARLGDENIDYQHTGGYELIFEKDLPALQHLDVANDLLRSIYPEAVYKNRPELVKKFGFNTKAIKSIIHNPYEGHVDTGKMMQALLRLARQKGIEIYTGAEVTAFEENDNFINVFVNDTCRGSVCFKAENIAVCTNAFTQKLLPELCITPGRGQVILTKPVENLHFEGAFHFDEGFYYFRNVGKRVLFGGGRNLAFEQETTTELQYNEKILTALERMLKEIILPGNHFEIDQKWSGIMGFSEDKQPIIKKISSRIVAGFACNGMGVSLASTVGDEIADLLHD